MDINRKKKKKVQNSLAITAYSHNYVRVFVGSNDVHVPMRTALFAYYKCLIRLLSPTNWRI